jgi:hypothetical protein
MRKAEWKSIEQRAWGREHSVKTDVGSQRSEDRGQKTEALEFGLSEL